MEKPPINLEKLSDDEVNGLLEKLKEEKEKRRIITVRELEDFVFGKNKDAANYTKIYIVVYGSYNTHVHPVKVKDLLYKEGEHGEDSQEAPELRIQMNLDDLAKSFNWPSTSFLKEEEETCEQCGVVITSDNSWAFCHDCQCKRDEEGP